ncbi:site-specific integrase [Halobacillus aidingensis]|uniref:Site-specific recombinase XerD n=1 Tax=Halobacillus aidingensis TaxID=240303 RepID=A0A1H0MK11_HALAD|nr:site-specific integrase [Halobacillus aidingensis]SDO80783.1 Site-specific recombinase XerD [Halobacillus aidingensis]
MPINYRKHGNGNWEYRIKYVDPFTGKRREKSKRGFNSKSEARFAAQEMEHKLLTNYEMTNHNLLLKDFLDEWLSEYKKDSVRKNTFELHKRNIKKHIIPYFQNLKLKELKPIIYQKFLNHLYDQGYSKRTREIVHGTLFGAMDKAYHLEKIERNPCQGAVIKGENKRKDIKFIESADIPTFLEQAYKYGYMHWIFFKVMIETGMRKGEAAALQWKDVDLKEKTISINKTLDFQAESKEQLFGDTKTYNSKRVITIRQSLANDLTFHLRQQNQNKTALNQLYHHDLDLVLCRKDGNFIPKSTLFNSFSRILKRSNLPQLPVHSLRHTHAVLLLEAGNDMKYIQERLGHGSMQITSDVYSHISKRIEKESIDRFDDHMNKIST